MSWPRLPVFVTPAIGLVAVLVLLHLIGARENVSILSGTAPPSDFAAVTGLFYVAAWLCAVVVAPTLVIAPVIRRLIQSRLGMKGPNGAGADAD